MRHIEARQRLLELDVVVVLLSGRSPAADVGRLQPARGRVGVADVLGPGVGSQQDASVAEPPFQLRLEGMELGAAVIGRGVRHAVVLRVGAEKLAPLNSRSGERPAGHLAVERIRHLSQELGTHRQVLVGKLVDLHPRSSTSGLPGTGEVHSFRACVAQFEQESLHELALDVQIPLLHIPDRLVGNRRAGIDRLAQQPALVGRIAPGRLKDAVREWIGKRGVWGKTVVQGRGPGVGDAIDGRKVGAHGEGDIVRHVEDAVAAAYDKPVGQAVGQTDARHHQVVLFVHLPPAGTLRRIHQADHAVVGRNQRVRSVGQEDRQPVEPLGPRPRYFPADTKVQGELAGHLEGVVHVVALIQHAPRCEAGNGQGSRRAIA